MEFIYSVRIKEEGEKGSLESGNTNRKWAEYLAIASLANVRCMCCVRVHYEAISRGCSVVGSKILYSVLLAVTDPKLVRSHQKENVLGKTVVHMKMCYIHHYVHIP